MKKPWSQIKKQFNWLKNHTPRWIKLLLAVFTTVILFGLFSYAFADSSSGDILAGTTKQATATLSGSGKLWFYLAEFVVACVAFIKSRNFTVFSGIIILAIVFNVFLSYFLT